MTNYRNKLSLRMEQWIITSREFLLKAYPKGNSDLKIEF
jgi:hypothetical protein